MFAVMDDSLQELANEIAQNQINAEKKKSHKRHNQNQPKFAERQYFDEFEAEDKLDSIEINGKDNDDDPQSDKEELEEE